MYNRKRGGVKLPLASFRSSIFVLSGTVTVKVLDNEESVVLVTTGSKDVGVSCERIANDSVSSLESDLGLEGVLTNSSDHLQWNIWAVEESGVIWGCTLITDTDMVLSSGDIRINIDADLTVEKTSEGVTSIINI